MEPWAVALVTVAIFGLVLFGFARLAIRTRKRRLGLSLMTPFADLWYPADLRVDTVVEAKSLRGDEAEGDGAPPKPGAEPGTGPAAARSAPPPA